MRARTLELLEATENRQTLRHGQSFLPWAQSHAPHHPEVRAPAASLSQATDATQLNRGKVVYRALSHAAFHQGRPQSDRSPTGLVAGGRLVRQELPSPAGMNTGTRTNNRGLQSRPARHRWPRPTSSEHNLPRTMRVPVTLTVKRMHASPLRDHSLEGNIWDKPISSRHIQGLPVCGARSNRATIRSPCKVGIWYPHRPCPAAAPRRRGFTPRSPPAPRPSSSLLVHPGRPLTPPLPPPTTSLGRTPSHPPGSRPPRLTNRPGALPNETESRTVCRTLHAPERTFHGRHLPPTNNASSARKARSARRTLRKLRARLTRQAPAGRRSQTARHITGTTKTSQPARRARLLRGQESQKLAG